MPPSGEMVTSGDFSNSSGSSGSGSSCCSTRRYSVKSLTYDSDSSSMSMSLHARKLCSRSVSETSVTGSFLLYP